MLPFRELEVYDSFLLNGKECDKVAQNKYLVINELGDAESLEIAEPNLMVEFIEDDEEQADEQDDFLCRYFFSTLLGLVEAAEEAGDDYMETKHLRSLAEFYLGDEEE